MQMTLNPWSKVQVLAGFSCVALHRRQKLFESLLGRYWFLGDHVLIQVNHSFPSGLLRDILAKDEATLLYTECLKLPLGCM